MAGLVYGKDDIEEKIRSLSKQGQVAFGVSCCERLLPNYVAFTRESNWGNQQPLHHALNRLWEYVDGGELSSQEAEKLASACEAVAPHSDDFGTQLGSAAQDAAFAICSVLDFLKTSEGEKIAQASYYAMATVDMYVQELEDMPANDPSLEETIRLHPIMQEELQRQEDDLVLLGGDWNASDLAAKWRSPESSNIGMS